MTTIVYDKTEHAFYADSQATDNRGYVMGHDEDKIHICDNGDVLVLAGSCAAIAVVEEDWPNLTADALEGAGDCNGFVYIPEEDKVLMLSVYECEVSQTLVCKTFPQTCTYALGSGMDYAIAALDMGHSGAAAIEYASTRDTCTNNRVKTLDLVTYKEQYDGTH